MNVNTDPYSTFYKIATIEAGCADRDSALAYDCAGGDMPEGGLTAAQEWALEFAEWVS
jgi:hypothetical protein